MRTIIIGNSKYDLNYLFAYTKGNRIVTHKIYAIVFVFFLLLIPTVGVTSEKYGAGFLVPSKAGAVIVPNSLKVVTFRPGQELEIVAFVFSWESKGDTILGYNNEFIPVADRFSVEGVIHSGIYNQVTKKIFVPRGLGKASISGWSHVKKGDSTVDWVLKLSSGHIVVPVNQALLELVIAGNNSNVTDPVSEASYPVEGRLRAKLTDFNDDGAVLNFSSEGGLYVRESEDLSTYISLADDPQFTIIEAEPTLMREAQKLLNELKQ